MVRQERSAGFIPFHQTDHSARQFLLLDYGRHWDFPKGHVERGEDDLTAARRELFEETGIARPVVIDGFREEIAYFFRHPRKGLIRKTVVFFLAEVSTIEVRLSHEHSGYEFLEYTIARSRLTFPSARKVLDAAQAWLNPPDKLSQSELFR